MKLKNKKLKSRFLKSREEPAVKVNVTTVTETHPVVNVTNPEGTTLYQFTKGLADILVSDENAAKSCQNLYWKIEQPTIQEGTDIWFKDLAKPVIAITTKIDGYVIDPICKSNSNKLLTYLYEKILDETYRYGNLTSSNKTYTDPTIVRPAERPLTVVDSFRFKAKEENKEVRHKKATKTKAKANNKRNKKISLSSKMKAKDWWKVLESSLPDIPFQINVFRMQLQKVLKGFIHAQFNEFIDCIGKEVNTGDVIHRRIEAYKRLMMFVRKESGIEDFLTVIHTALCNWNQFYEFGQILKKAIETSDKNTRWNLYGKAIAQWVVTLSTGKINVDLV